jgi:hypothetical protein
LAFEVRNAVLFHAFSLSQHFFTWDNMVIVLYHPARVANLTVGVRNTMQSTVGCITQSSCDHVFLSLGKTCAELRSTSQKENV